MWVEVPVELMPDEAQPMKESATARTRQSKQVSFMNDKDVATAHDSRA